MSATDKELLEMAARASGIEVRWTDQDIYRGSFLRRVVPKPDVPCSEWIYWRPLIEPGDALCLAVKLDIHIKRYSGATTAQELCAIESHTEHDHWAQNGNDPMLSTCRAIVICAAEIGKSMTKESDHEH